MKRTKKLENATFRQKWQRRKARAKQESADPAIEKKRSLENVPRTLDNTRESDQSIFTAERSPCEHYDARSCSAEMEDGLSKYVPWSPKVLITTSPKATKATYEFCEELVGVFPGSQFVGRRKGKEFDLGRISSWAANRNYGHLIIVNEDMKKPNALTLVCLPSGPTAYFRLTSIELTRTISGHARSTPHNPELILNNFATHLGNTIGRIFQTLFPPIPEFQGRQVVTLHNQRDFLFFRRHRYAFRSTEKVALQEIGPRFTLKLQWLKNGIPMAHGSGDNPMPLELDVGGASVEKSEDENKETTSKRVLPLRNEEFLWARKPKLESSRRAFFL